MKSVIVQHDMSRLKDERSLLIAITIEGIYPIIGFLPNVILAIIGGLFNNWNELGQPWHIFGIEIIIRI